MKHYEKSVTVNTNADVLFDFVDNHRNFTSHMNKPSMMMGGGSMVTTYDEGEGKQLGSHIIMKGTAFGIKIFLDEVITVYEKPYHKQWKTVGDLNILVIGNYTLGFDIEPVEEHASRIRVYIDYEKPQGFGQTMLYFLLGRMYAKWCVHQMTEGVSRHFA